MLIQAIASKYTGHLFAFTANGIASYRMETQQYKAKKRMLLRKKKRKAEYETLLHYPRLAATSLQDYSKKVVNAIITLNGGKYYQEFTPVFQGNESTLVGITISRGKFQKFYDSWSAPVGEKILGSISYNQQQKNQNLGWRASISFCTTMPLKEEEITHSGNSSAQRYLRTFPGINIGSGYTSEKAYLKKSAERTFISHYDICLYLKDFPKLMEQYALNPDAPIFKSR